MSDEQDLLFEATASARRERDASGRAVAPPSWWDLSPDMRAQAFELQTRTRQLESAFDRQGYSGTVRAVMARLEDRG